MSDQVPLRPAHPGRTPVRDLVERLGDRLVALHGGVGSDGDARDVGDVAVSGVTMSSLRVRPGDLYVAPAGARSHGAAFLAQAAREGAVAALTDPDGARLADAAVVAGDLPAAFPVLVVDRPRAVVGDLAALVNGRPAERLRLLAVTGTQGKTTTTRLAEGALTAAGVPAAVVGTVGTRVAGLDVPTSLTTPEAPDLHALFAVMVERGVAACAMEVSSHALVMGRVDGVVFDVACFTNLGRDHLDFHADVEEYYAAKASLFTPARTRRALVNVDDEHGRRLAAECEVPVRTFSTTGRPADWWADDVRPEPTGSRFTVHTPSGEVLACRVPLAGAFNVSNALCAVAGLGELGYAPAAVAAAMSGVAGVPGRLEQVDAGQDFLVVVDYAHKPDAVTAALDALRPLTRGRLVLVIGAGGDRDTGKRPIMGEIAARLADVVVVTDDNPRSEDPAAIRAQLLAGTARLPDGERAEVHEVGDRRAAIRLAVGVARDGDTVLVAGKGHETGQVVAGTTYPFDDRDVLREELTRR